MAIGISPQRLREVRFAEQWRGYRTEEVDEFVEQVAEAFDVLEERLHDASERAARAEHRLVERGADDDLSRTLVLAQRTADAALREAEVEAARLVSEAGERARAVTAEAEGRAARSDAEIQARAETELHELAERRRALTVDVELLTSYVEQERARLADDLRQRLAWLEASDHLEAGWLRQRPLPGSAGTGEDEDREEAALAKDGSEDSVESPPLDSAAAPPPDLATPDAPTPNTVTEISAPETATEMSTPETAVVEPLPMAETATGHVDPAEANAPQPEDPLPAFGGADDLERDPTPGWRVDERPEMVSDDDPFIAELRRAVDDPEPLGPRDSTSDWEDQVANREEGSTSTGRFRRRRQR